MLLSHLKNKGREILGGKKQGIKSMPCINSIRTQQIRPLLSDKSENYQLVRVSIHLSFLLSNELLFLLFLVPVLTLSAQKGKRDKGENKATK